MKVETHLAVPAARLRLRVPSASPSMFNLTWLKYKSHPFSWWWFLDTCHMGLQRPTCQDSLTKNPIDMDWRWERRKALKNIFSSRGENSISCNNLPSHFYNSYFSQKKKKTFIINQLINNNERLVGSILTNQHKIKWGQCGSCVHSLQWWHVSSSDRVQCTGHNSDSN